MMHNFFLPLEHFTQQQITFPAPQARQIRQVLRMAPGQRVLALDDLGWAYELELAEVSASAVHAWMVRKFPAPGEPRNHLTLLVSLSQREKFEWILQKCTEVGVSAFVPVISSRSLVRSINQVENKMDRWRAILREAAEQCGRGRIPSLHPPLPFVHALERIAPSVSSNPLRLILWEAEQSVSLGNILKMNDGHIPLSLHILVGPEGGYTPEEVTQAHSMGYQTVSLGGRVMRMETAAIVAAALAFYQLGDLEATGIQSDTDVPSSSP